MRHLQEESQQLNFFRLLKEIQREFQVVNKVPYKFSYKFEDDSGKVPKIDCDWEIECCILIA